MKLARKRIASPTPELRQQLFEDAIDAVGELHSWATGHAKRTFLWFWWQLRTTYQFDYYESTVSGKASKARLTELRRASAIAQKKQLRLAKESKRPDTPPAELTKDDRRAPRRPTDAAD
jgi:hypothetical protein